MGKISQRIGEKLSAIKGVLGKKESSGTSGKKEDKKEAEVEKEEAEKEEAEQVKKEEKKGESGLGKPDGGKSYYEPDAVKKRGKERHLTSAYNFAGPGTEYRARMKGSAFYKNMMEKAGKKLVGTAPYNKPINKLDACAKKHDSVYARSGATAKEVKQADRDFQLCASKIKVSDGVNQKLLSIASRVGFEGKIALENVGVLRKGSFSSGGSKKGGIIKA